MNANPNLPTLIEDTLSLAKRIEYRLAQACRGKSRPPVYWAVSVFFLRRARSLLNALRALSALRLTLDAKEILARSLFETAVHAECIYASDSPFDLAERFHEYDAWIAYRAERGDVELLRRHRATISPEKAANVSKLEASARAFCERYCTTRHEHDAWSGKSLFQMAEAAGLRDEYDQIFRQFSNVTHGAVRSIRSLRSSCAHTHDRFVLSVGIWSVLTTIVPANTLWRNEHFDELKALFDRWTLLDAEFSATLE